MKLEIAGRKITVPQELITASIIGYASWLMWVSLAVFKMQGDIAMIKDRFYKMDIAAREWSVD